ncbi:leucine-rich repeat domain-containing protein [Winogradskyella sp. PC D3.3]
MAWSTANWTNIDATASFSTSCVATPCTVNIPDANFKAYLVGNSVINTNGDTEIQCSEATAFTGLINCSSLSISDLTGIEAFINITDLICRDNNLTSIDISAIPNLGGLDCSDNQLTSLDTSLNTGLYNLRCANNALTSIDLSTHPYINTLYCNGNNITTLNLSNLTTLYDLNCSDNQITSIDASNIPLQYFECQNNALTSLNVANGNNYNIVDFEATNNPNLPCIQVDDVAYSTTNWTNIDAASSFSTSCAACVVNIPNANLKQILVSVADTNGNNEVECTAAIAYTGTLSIGYLGLTNLIGVEAFINVTNISCPSNNITSYDFSANTQLTYLYINDNNFTSLDVSSLTNLETLYVSFNNLTGLDVSNLSNLEDLAIYNNQITSLDVSTNTSLESLHCGLNSLTSLNVANGNNTNFTSFNAESNPNLTCIQVDNVAYSTTNWTDIDPTASYSTNCSACTVNIPDANFKTYLVGNAAINTDGDTEISCSEAMAFNGTIDCSNLSIADLTGIEAFTSLAKLYSHTNQLTSLDVSDITTLNYLTCYGNQLTSLDLSNNTALTYLNYSENQITSLDLSNNTALEYLFCNDNQITSLDLSNNTALVKLSCTTNQLTSLDVSVNTALEDLNCSVNQLISLDLSNNTALTKMYCVDNQITDLDISALTVLESLFCNENELTSLNIANTNNANMLHMFANDNPNLSCIQVDDVAYSAANWTNIDPIVNFSTNCRGLSVGDFMKNTVSIYPNPTTSVLNIKMDSNLKRATIYSTLGAIVLETTSKTIATANLKSGFYLIRIEDENGNIATNRFIKE